MHLLDYIILAIIFIGLVLAVSFMIRQKKRGKIIGCSSCNRDCSTCPVSQVKKHDNGRGV